MNELIHIQRVLFDFNMDSEEMAFELNSSWHSFYQSSFEAVAKKVLQRFSPGNNRLLINRMELDLGTISRDNFYTRFPQLLEEKLEEQLSAFLSSEDETKQLRILTEQQTEIESFCYFLIHGYFPWGDSSGEHNIRQLFIKVLTSSASEFREFLFLQGYRSVLRKRLVYQLDDPQLDQVVKLTHAAESKFIIHYTHSLLSRQTKQELTDTLLYDYRNTIWYFIVSYLLMNGGSIFNRKEFVRQTIGDIAQHYNLAYSHFLLLLIAYLGETPTHDQVKSELESIINELIMEQQNQTNNLPKEKESEEFIRLLESEDSSKELPTELQKRLIEDKSFRHELFQKLNPQQLVCLFEKMSRTDLPLTFRQKFESEISEWIQENTRQLVNQKLLSLRKQTQESPLPEYLRDEYLALLKQPLSRRKLIQQLNETELGGLVKLIEPVEAGFIITYSKSLDRQKERNLFEGRAGGEFRLLKWEFIFAILVEDHIPSFNRKAFVLSVISMLASHYSLDRLQLLSFIYQGMLANELPAPEYLSEIIKELYFETKEQKHPKQESDAFTQEMQDLYYCEQLLSFLQTGIIHNQSFETKVYSAFQYLKTYRTDLLLQITETLKQGLVLTAEHIVSAEKQLYRELLLFVIETYQVSLPGGRNVQSFLTRLSEDSFRTISKETFRSLLLAILKNDLTLYNQSWDLLTEKTDNVSLLVETEIKQLDNNLLIKILLQHNHAETIQFMQKRKNQLFERIESDKELFCNLSILLNEQAGFANSLSEVFGNSFPSFIFTVLNKFYPEHARRNEYFYQLAQSPLFKLQQTIRLLLWYSQIMALKRTNPLNYFFKHVSSILPELKNKEFIDEAKKVAARKNIDFTLQNEINQAIETVASEKAKTGNKNQYTLDSTEYFLNWLSFQFGTGSGLPEPSDEQMRLNDQIAYHHFANLLTKQPELILNLLDLGKLSAEKLAPWIKKAPFSVRLHWLQISASPYQRIIIHDVFTILQWIRSFFNTHHLSVPEDKITCILIDFCSGIHQLWSRTELLNELFSKLLQIVEPEKHHALFAELQQKATNKGADWKHKIDTAILTEQQTDQTDEPAHEQPKKTKQSENEDQETLESIYLNNAGLVLCSPFLPRLFTLLQLTVDGQFIDQKQQNRAVLLLQYLLFQNTAFPEHEMVLNKLLCGFSTGTPIDSKIEISDKEKETLESMLPGMISNWKILGNTSPAGLRETFLIRTGKLEQKSDAWYLTVEQKGFDVLLDQLPWSYTPIKHPWMRKIIHVKWR